MNMTKQNISKPIIAAHLDFKGVQFRPDYFPQLFQDLASQRINAVLVEYEDVFPFDEINVAFDKEVVWTRADLDRFLELARENEIEVIPLQQCLGHLEYVFRWNRYRHLALDPAYPSTLHLAKDDAKALILKMLEEVVAAHPDSRYVHLGMDEAHSLVLYAKEEKREVLELFLQLLDELCAVCERHGKTPIIWSDMFEDHLTPNTLPRLKQFKDRVVLCPWDYGSRGERIAVGRIAGFRASKYWLEHPDDLLAPAISAGIEWIEEMAPDVRELVAPYLEEHQFISMFQADLWASLGFEVLGASGARVSGDGTILPLYVSRYENIRAWSRAAQRAGILGQVATSWARGTTFCAPNFLFDLSWPQLGEMARTMGANPAPFFEEVAPATVERIVLSIGRCRDDWRIEAELLREMERLRPQLQSHQYEWQSLILMLRVWERLRHAQFLGLEVSDFLAGLRLVDSEWGRRLRDQTEMLETLPQLREEVRAHFSERYYGEVFEEWLRYLFDAPLTQVAAIHEISLQHEKAAGALHN